MTRSLETALAWLAVAVFPAAQQARPGPPPQVGGVNDRTFSGQIVDGLGRPVPGVKVTVQPTRYPYIMGPKTDLRTDEDGRYSGTFAPEYDDAQLKFDREGYGSFGVFAARRAVITLRRKVDLDEAAILPARDGDGLDQGVRELLASWEWDEQDKELLGFLFRYHGRFRPALRRLLDDPNVGTDARDWLDLLDDPGDRDLFAKGRQYATKEDVKETDLIEALKAAARPRKNLFKPDREPSIAIDFFLFTTDLDGALVRCGIDRGGLTGTTWQFVFRRVGPKWELRSAKLMGRG